MTFTGYPFAAGWSNDDSNLDQQAAAHNQVEVAANEMQNMITALEGQMASVLSVGDALTEFLSLFAAPVTYVPTLTNITVGASPGEAWGRYVRLGNLVFLQAGFRLAAGFTMHATAPFGVALPFTADLDATKLRRPVFVSYANNSSANQRTSGAGITLPTDPGKISRFANEATGLGWDAGSPYTWQVGDDMELAGHYWAIPLGG